MVVVVVVVVILVVVGGGGETKVFLLLTEQFMKPGTCRGSWVGQMLRRRNER